MNGGWYTLGDVRTNIEVGTELWHRLQQVNQIYINETIVAEYKRTISRGWFRKPRVEKWYKIIDGYDNAILIDQCDLHGAELYLLGIINGDKIHQNGWAKCTPQNKKEAK